MGILEGKVAVVTGAARGHAKAVAAPPLRSGTTTCPIGPSTGVKP